MPIILTGGTYPKILLTMHGKIAMDLNCCCGASPSPSPSVSPWPPDEESQCPCIGGFVSPRGSVTIDGVTDDLQGTLACGNLCVPPYYDGDIECTWSNINDTYDLDVTPTISGWYGEANLGTWDPLWTYGDPIVDPGILVWKSTSCFPAYPIHRDYVWQIRCWYDWCLGTCPPRDEFEFYDPTRVRGRLTIEVKIQWFSYISPNHGGSTAIYRECYDHCTHVGICTGGHCITEDGIEISMSAGAGNMGGESGDLLGLEDGNILGEE